MFEGNFDGSSNRYGLWFTLILFNTSVLHATNPGPSYNRSFIANSPYPILLFIVMVGLGFEPLFVIIIITPVAALAPNTAAELASFNTSIVAISFGLISLKAPV